MEIVTVTRFNPGAHKGLSFSGIQMAIWVQVVMFGKQVPHRFCTCGLCGLISQAQMPLGALHCAFG